jgi:hypothetical protein
MLNQRSENKCIVQYDAAVPCKKKLDRKHRWML